MTTYPCLTSVALLFFLGACETEMLPDAMVLDGGTDVLDDATLDAEIDGDTVLDSGPRKVTCTQSITGMVSDPALDEISGVVVSRSDSEVLFVHNDSGDANGRFYAIGRDGVRLNTFELKGAQSTDWEDVAVTNSFLYLADIGDNAARMGGTPRASIQVYRLTEPAITGDGSTLPIDSFDRLNFVYDDGGHDCESLFVTRDAQMYFITKEPNGMSGVYTPSMPVTVDGTNTLVRMANIAFGTPAAPGTAFNTGADVSGDDSRVFVRTYSSVLSWTRMLDETWLAALMRDAEELKSPTPIEPQGEAIAWDPQGGYVTISEGNMPSVYTFACDF